MENNQNNRRLFERFDSEMSIWVRVPQTEEDFLLVESANISAGGLLIHLDFPLQAGTLLDVRFELPQNNDLVEARAKVKHCVEKEKGVYQIGVQFSEVRNYTVPVLMAYLEALFH